MVGFGLTWHCQTPWNFPTLPLLEGQGSIMASYTSIWILISLLPDQLLGLPNYSDMIYWSTPSQPSIYRYGICFNGVIETGGLCYGYWIFVNIFSIFFSLYLQVEKLNTKKSLLRVSLEVPQYYLLSNNSILQMIVLTSTQTFSLSQLCLSSVIMIVAMLTWERLKV